MKTNAPSTKNLRLIARLTPYEASIVAEALRAQLAAAKSKPVEGLVHLTRAGRQQWKDHLAELERLAVVFTTP